jgi:hypothetical protein
MRNGTVVRNRCFLTESLNVGNSDHDLYRRAVTQVRRLVAGFPPRRPGFEPGSDHSGFVVDKVALGQVFSEYFGFPCQLPFHRLLHNHHHLSSAVGTVGPTGRSTRWTQSHSMRKISTFLLKAINDDFL